MKRQKLLEIKRTLGKMDHHIEKQLVHTLVDTCLQQMDELEGGPDVQQMMADLLERTRQLNLAIKDIQNLASEAWVAANRNGDPAVMRAVAKVKLTTELAQEMFRSKTTMWRREWGWYLPRLHEEFGDDGGLL